MSQPKDYDSTLARMAGNIAAGMLHSGLHRSEIAAQATDIAERIITICREKFAAALAENERNLRRHLAEKQP